MEIMENRETGRIFKYEYIECHGLYNITLHNPTDKNRPLGRCTVVQPLEKTAPIILDFVIYSQEHRRKKFGTDLMGFVKYLFANGIKSWFYSKAGKEFAQKTGWKEIKTEKGKFLFYSKETANGSSTIREIPTDGKNNKAINFKKEEKEEEIQKEKEVKSENKN